MARITVDTILSRTTSKDQTMQRFDTLSRELAGVMLILGPALIVLAAVLKALEIGGHHLSRLRPHPGQVLRTPLIPLHVEDAPARIFLKLENLQPTGASTAAAMT
jgi:hypothetical protein